MNQYSMFETEPESELLHWARMQIRRSNPHFLETVDSGDIDQLKIYYGICGASCEMADGASGMFGINDKGLAFTRFEKGYPQEHHRWSEIMEALRQAEMEDKCTKN